MGCLALLSRLFLSFAVIGILAACQTRNASAEQPTWEDSGAVVRFSNSILIRIASGAGELKIR